MATVVTVHGTFAHTAGTADALNIGVQAEPQWWQEGSAFDADLKAFASGEEGPIHFIPFTWSSANSELNRRKAGADLLHVMRQLDAQSEPYCVVGHSHGGSVIASALIESVARKKPLTHLKKWITIGTPFVGMRKERFLFSRLTLSRKVMFVASLMLFMMFLFYVGAEALDDAQHFRNERYYTAILFSGIMMTLPIVVFYLIFRFVDNRELMGYSAGAVERAKQYYQDKWLPLCHKDDEAVQGLRILPNVKLHFFEPDFATSMLTKASIVALPLLYLLALTSPTIMLGIADFLQTRVYDVQAFASEDSSATQARDELRSLGRRMREAREQAERGGLDPASAEDARKRADEIRKDLFAKRQQLDQSFPEFSNVERAQRFKRRFLQHGRPPQACEQNRLCGLGHDYALNSKLLFHVVTDELSAAVVDDDSFGGAIGGILRLLVPIVLVPLVFAVIALGVLAVIQYIAAHVSVWLSRGLNYLTLTEVRRSTFGNDTEGEIVVGADYGPSWLEPVTCMLPTEVSDQISAHSNAMAAQSIAKFRNAISTLAFAEGEDSKSGLIANYLSWKELVHTSYFDAHEFRKIIVQAIAQAEGFKPTDSFKWDGDFDRTSMWLADLGKKMDPATGLVIGETPPVAPLPT